MVVPSSLNGINDLLEGGYEEGLPIAFFGLPESGKSVLLMQEAVYNAAMRESGTIIVDTEGGDLQMLRKWCPVFEKRFNAKVNIVKTTLKTLEPGKSFKLLFDQQNWNSIPIFVVNLRKMQKFMAFFGYGVELKLSDKGKFGLRSLGATRNFCADLLDEYNVASLLIDSLSEPLSIFSGGLVNYPARADALKMFFVAIQDIGDEYEPVILMSHHATFDPQNPYSEPTMYGGKWVKHNTKISLYLQESRSKKRDQLGIRRVYLTRYFDKRRFAEMRKIKLLNEGFVDV